MQKAVESCRETSFVGLWQNRSHVFANLTSHCKSRFLIYHLLSVSVASVQEMSAACLLSLASRLSVLDILQAEKKKRLRTRKERDCRHTVVQSATTKQPASNGNVRLFRSRWRCFLLQQSMKLLFARENLSVTFTWF